MLRKTLGVAAAAVVLAAAGCAEQDVGDSGDQAAVAYPSKTLQIMAPAARRRRLGHDRPLDAEGAAGREPPQRTVGRGPQRHRRRRHDRPRRAGHQPQRRRPPADGHRPGDGRRRGDQQVAGRPDQDHADRHADRRVGGHRGARGLQVHDAQAAGRRRRRPTRPRSSGAAARPAAPTRSWSACWPRPPAPTPRRSPSSTSPTPAAARPRPRCCPATSSVAVSERQRVRRPGQGRHRCGRWRSPARSPRTRAPARRCRRSRRPGTTSS